MKLTDLKNKERDHSDYEKDTKQAYRNPLRAKTYKKKQTRKISWIRFTTWRERLYVERCLRQCNLKRGDKILDIPCGTGILANVLNKFPASIIASDISSEMMNLAQEDYRIESFGGFIRTDITKAPFKKEAFCCVITLGLMHRLPAYVRKQVLQEIKDLSKRFVIISFSIDNLSQRIKQFLIKKIRHSYQSAPSPAPLSDVIEELKSNGLVLKKRFTVMPFLSAEVVLFLEKNTLK